MSKQASNQARLRQFRDKAIGHIIVHEYNGIKEIKKRVVLGGQPNSVSQSPLQCNKSRAGLPAFMCLIYIDI
jgi:hypothetical protein